MKISKILAIQKLLKFTAGKCEFVTFYKKSLKKVPGDSPLLNTSKAIAIMK